MTVAHLAAAANAMRNNSVRLHVATVPRVALCNPPRPARTLAKSAFCPRPTMLVRVLQLLAAATALLHAVDAVQPTVKLPTGATISGLVKTNVQGKQVNEYLGIPYTDAPVGDKRWTQSKVKTLTVDINATAYSDVCHGDPSLDAASGQFPNNEDCLYLNVFTPAGVAPSARLPVMVWVHGGGFISGAANPYDAANLIGASGQKVIVVNFNYRLGAFGFFSNEEILNDGDGANFGLRDQETAFQWVKKYIAAFGGNPNDITAFGESAGAISLAHLLVARDGTQKLFNRAILQSGGFTSAQGTTSTAKQAQESASLAAAVGCDKVQGRVLDCLRKAPARAIFNASVTFKSFPTVDKVFMNRLPFLSLLQGKVSRVPTIIGSNTNDGWYFAMQASEASQFDSYVRSSFSLMNEHELARLAALYPAAAFPTAQHRISEIFQDNVFVCAGEIYSDLLSLTVPNTYRYRFNFPTFTFGIPLTLHAADLEYVFDRQANLANTTDATAVVDHFQKFWTNFALTGSPNGKTRDDPNQINSTPLAGVWPRYDVLKKQQILLQPTLEVESDSAYMPQHSERCAFWFQLEARIAAEFK